MSVVAKGLYGSRCHMAGGRPRSRLHCVRWGSYIVLDGDPAPPKRRSSFPPLFGPCLLWPNGWMDQHATWYGGWPRPRRHCVRWGPSYPYGKGTAPPLFGACLLWPNGLPCQQLLISCTNGHPKSRPRPRCVRWGGPSSPSPKIP